MVGISANMARELAEAWEVAAAEDRNASPLRRETLRECADMIRMLSGTQIGTCPRATGPFKLCFDCDGSFECQLPGRTPRPRGAI